MKYTLIAVVMAAVLFAGCSDKKKEDAAKKPAVQAIVQQAAKTNEVAAANPAEPALPDVPEKPVVIKDEFGWQTEFPAAQQLARRKKLPILADFSGSDWCGYCIKLDREVFSQEIFKKWAKDNVVLFLADFPRRNPQTTELKIQNRKLMQKYGVEGLPTVLLLDAEGTVLQKTGYVEGGAQVYVDNLKVLLQKSDIK